MRRKTWEFTQNAFIPLIRMVEVRSATCAAGFFSCPTAADTAASPAAPVSHSRRFMKEDIPRSGDLTPGSLLRRFVQLDGIPVGIFELDLPAAGTREDLVPKPDARGLERGHGGIETVDVEDDPVRSPGFLPAAVGQRLRAGALRAAQKEMKIPAGDGRDRARPLRQLEADRSGVEGDGSIQILDQIADHRRGRAGSEDGRLHGRPP